VHGALGYSFADSDESAYDKMLSFFVSQGVTTVLASLSTARLDDLCAQMTFVAAYNARLGGVSPIAGVHLEGPYLDRGQRGAHNINCLQTPSVQATRRLLEHLDVLRMVTLAPELEGSQALVRALSEAGVIAAVGHSATGPVDLQRAVAGGLRHITHLWSGQTNLTRSGPWRQPGLLEMSLASDRLTAEIIADGKHLPDTLLEIARRCLGGRLCIVSDGSAGTGLPEGTRYEKDGVPCVVRDNVAMVVDEDSFAGSVTPLNSMMAYLTDSLNWTVPEVVSMASGVPAKVLGLDGRKGNLAKGFDADIAIFDRGFRVWGVLRAGRWSPV
jgi:N-acetylglucosamine-6-phosphate deacetylase